MAEDKCHEDEGSSLDHPEARRLALREEVALSSKRLVPMQPAQLDSLCFHSQVVAVNLLFVDAAAYRTVSSLALQVIFVAALVTVTSSLRVVQQDHADRVDHVDLVDHVGLFDHVCLVDHVV